MTALLICSSRRRSVRAGSAWVTASARSNSGSASVMCPCTAVTSVSTCSAQPMAQLSSASVAAASALVATRPAFSTSPRLLCVRAASTSSLARCRAEIPGAASARSSVASDSADEPATHAALRQRPVQVHEQVGLGGVLQRAVRHLFGLCQVTDAVEGVGEPAGQPAVLGRAGRGTGHGPGEELGRDPGRLADQQVGRAGQPAQHPLVHRLGRSAEPAGRPQHLPGHPVGRRARLRQGAPRVAVPGGAQRRRHIVVQRRPDQRVPEPEAVAGLGQHASGACLVHRRDQVRHAAAEHDRQIGDREIRAEQGRRPQHIAHRPGHEAEAVRYGRGQRARRGTARQLGRSRLGDGQPGAAGQRGDQFGDVERVARRPVGEPHQAVVGPAAGQRRYQVGHRRRR